MGPDDRLVALGVAMGGFGPLVVSGALVPLRGHLNNANVALVFVLVVVVAAAAGGRWAGVVAAAVSTLSFDFFFTRPYLSLKIDRLADVETTLLLLVVGLVVGELVVWLHRGRRELHRGRDEIARLRRVAELVAKGAETEDVGHVVEAELIGLLSLRECEFDPAPVGAPLPRLERNGSIATLRRRFVAGEFALPAEGVELPVLGRGYQLGRFVLTPDPDVGVSIEERVVAVALADQFGAVLAAEREIPGSDEEKPWPTCS